jgi:DNA topoisomerase I
MPRLRRVDCSMPGIARRRAGRGFYYVDAEGSRVRDPDILDRIRALVIPPAWRDVWICPVANGHIQAVGTDARGRRQYRYHDTWRAKRDREKFDHMLEFAAALPRLRRHCQRALAGDDGLGRERVLAAAVRLLDLGFFRIGTEDYADDNQSYGLATIEKRHVRVGGDVVAFDYPAKSGQRRIQTVVDPLVADVVGQLRRRRSGGPRLLAARDPASRRWKGIASDEINAQIKSVTGGDFTSKDFRTWSATVLAAVALAVSTGAGTPAARKRAVARAMKEVAHYLGNTPAVARASYVDPRVVDLYHHGVTVEAALTRLGSGPRTELGIQGAVERAVLAMLAEGQDGSSGSRAA